MAKKNSSDKIGSMTEVEAMARLFALAKKKRQLQTGKKDEVSQDDETEEQSIEAEKLRRLMVRGRFPMGGQS